jgi:ATP-dependent DNA ligase
MSRRGAAERRIERLSGMTERELRTLLKRLRRLTARKMTVDAPPPTTSRFGKSLELSRVHWVRPELIVEVTYLTRTDDGLLWHVVYEGLREDKSPVRCAGPNSPAKTRFERRISDALALYNARGYREATGAPPAGHRGRRDQ